MQYNTDQHRRAGQSSVQCNTVEYKRVQYSIVQYNTLLYHSIALTVLSKLVKRTLPFNSLDSLRNVLVFRENILESS